MRFLKISQTFFKTVFILCILFSLSATEKGFSQLLLPDETDLPTEPADSSQIDLKSIPYKIVYETRIYTEGRMNWELFISNANGSNKINLTRTPDLDEMYPHVSPDGTKICFVVDEGSTRRDKVRSVYYMNIDGSDRVEVARNAREPCWNPDGTKIAYLNGEYSTYSIREYATSELMIYDLKTAQAQAHPNKDLQHLYAICWNPQGDWFLGVMQGNSEYSDMILAFEADGTHVFDLERWSVKGCRPDLRFDGKKVAWGETDWDLRIGDITFDTEIPAVTDIQKFVKCDDTMKVYHVDFSPDGKYIAFSYGPKNGGQQVGGPAPGWDICVTDLTGNWVKVTTDGNHNKEPDWVPVVSKIEQAQKQDSNEFAKAN